MFTRYTLLLPLWVCASTVFGHALTYDLGETPYLKKDNLSASAAIGYRSSSATQSDEAWLIPGIMIGGEALPPEEGFQLDTISVEASKTFNADYQVFAEVSSHSGHDEYHLEIDNLWFAIPVYRQTPVFLDIGKMSTLATPTANWKASHDVFSEPSLLSDVFFGRHFSDTGVRLRSVLRDTLEVGLEVWNGSNWPATAGDNSQYGFIGYNTLLSDIQLHMRAWISSAQANNRRDERYSDDHHSDVVASNSDFRFDGDVDMQGVLLQLKKNWLALDWITQLEWIQQDNDGVLRDTAESAAYQSDIEGYRWSLSGEYKQVMGSLRYEVLSSQTVFGNAVSSTFIANSQLVNDSHEPDRLVASFMWRFMEDLAARIEVIQDRVQTDETDVRSAVGLVWTRSFDRF